MKHVIIAPHPDDEWIGCGCMMLNKLDNKQKIKVLILTRVPRTERRISSSKKLAKKYRFQLRILGEPERKINKNKLKKFLLRNINKKDVIYIPDFDAHIDHRTANKTVKQNLKNNQIYEYAVYNNSLNPFIRLKNKFLELISNKGFPSFKRGEKGQTFKYNLDFKKEIIKRDFYELPRGPDLLRKIK